MEVSGRLVTTVLIVIGLGTTNTNGEVYSSVADMMQVFQLERDLVGVMLEFAQRTEHKLNKIKRYLSDYASTTLSDSIVDGAEVNEALAGNPILTYNVVKRLTIDFPNIEAELKRDDWKESSVAVQRLRLGSVVPREQDLHGAAQALIRLQDVYELDISELAQGKVGRRETYAKLTAQDCLFMGKHSYNGGSLSRSLEWFEEAWQLAGEEANSTISQDQVKQFLDHAAKEHDERVLRGEKSGSLFPRPVYEEAPQEQRSKLIRGRTAKLARNETELELLSFDDDAHNFAALCRGEEMRIGGTAHLKCSYDHRGEPFFYLQPVKTEVVHDKPEILVFHDIINSHELEEIKLLAHPLLVRSQVMGSRAGTNEVSNTRTSKTGWLQDALSPTVSRLGERIAMVTGLHTDTLQEDAELLQVANYMNGGHYNPHHDYVMKEKDPNHMIYLPEKNLYIGDRVATWMFYLSEVGEGGRTVFPRVGAGVDPVPGSAVFWYNVLPTGEPDKLTLHGACPVLFGTKWVANKWIREGSQLFKRPCPASHKPKSPTGPDEKSAKNAEDILVSTATT